MIVLAVSSFSNLTYFIYTGASQNTCKTLGDSHMFRFFSFLLLACCLLGSVTSFADPVARIDHYYAYSDTAFVTYGEEAGFDWTMIIDSLDMPVNICAIEYFIAWDWVGEHTNYVPTYLSSTGYFSRSPTENGVYVHWIDSTNYQMGNQLWLGNLFFICDLEPSEVSSISVGGSVSFYDSVGQFHRLNFGENTILFSLNPLRGDVTGNGIVNIQDSQRLFEILSTNNWRQRYTRYDNPSFGRALGWPWSTDLDVFCIDRWSRNHFDPLTIEFNIGQPLRDPQPGISALPGTPWLNGNQLMVNTAGAAVAVTAFLPNGQKWHSASWTENGIADLGELPDGVNLENVTVMARGINGVLEVNPNRADPVIPQSLSLQAFPNPFNPATEISFELQRTETIKLSVYNINGQLVTTLFQGRQPAGLYTFRFDGSGLASGSYICRLQTENLVSDQRIVLLK